MDCTKCLYDVACDLNRRMSGNNNPLKYDKECPIFKDKSLYIEVPCKVGDWVWYICNKKINKSKIEELKYSASKHGYFSDDWLFHAYDFKKKEEVNFWRDDIGKTVFLTREEAEKALAERSRDERN